MAGNIYLLKITSDTRGEVAIFSRWLVITDSQIADLLEKYTDLEEMQEKAADLQTRIAQSNEQIVGKTYCIVQFIG